MQIKGERAATACGLVAILLWSTASGLIRSVSEIFGPLGGAALIYSLGAILLVMFLGRPRLRSTSSFYLIVGTALFVAYEVCLSLALGYASNSNQAIELGVVNYLWPCLTVLLAIVMNGQKARWIIVPGTVLALFGIVWVVSGNGLSLPAIIANVASNPLSYSLALACNTGLGDDPERADGIAIPNPANALARFSLAAGKTVNCRFDSDSSGCSQAQ